VLGCKTAQGRFDDTERMLDWAWDAYSRLRLTTRNKVLSVSQFLLPVRLVVRRHRLGGHDGPGLA
jgi:D-alanyl-D-alanine carboxypeptidase